MESRVPDFVIIGAQKAASTYLAMRLGRHPGLFVAPGELPYFEDPDYTPGTWSLFVRNFRDTEHFRMVGFKRANYLGKPEVASRLSQHLPDARLIAILRNPIDRAISAYFHYMRSGFIPVKPLEDGMMRVMDGSMAARYPAARDIIDYGMYFRHLARYLQYFPLTQICVVVVDDLVAAEGEVLDTVGSFLGVEGIMGGLDHERRAQATTTSLTRLRIVRAIRPLHSRQNRERSRTYPRKGPVALAVRNAAVALDRFVLAPLIPGKASPPSPGLRSRLVQTYVEDVGALATLLGRDLLSLWTATPG